MTGTFTRPMPIGDGKTIAPTGRRFALPMATLPRALEGRHDGSRMAVLGQPGFHEATGAREVAKSHQLHDGLARHLQTRQPPSHRSRRHCRIARHLVCTRGADWFLGFRIAPPKSHIDANLRVPLSGRARVREVLSDHQRRRGTGRLSRLVVRSPSGSCPSAQAPRVQRLRLLSDRLRQETPTKNQGVPSRAGAKARRLKARRAMIGQVRWRFQLERFLEVDQWIQLRDVEVGVVEVQESSKSEVVEVESSKSSRRSPSRRSRGRQKSEPKKADAKPAEKKPSASTPRSTPAVSARARRRCAPELARARKASARTDGRRSVARAAA